MPGLFSFMAMVKKEVIKDMRLSRTFKQIPFQRERRKYSELRKYFYGFRGIRPFREIRVKNYHFNQTITLFIFPS